MKPYIPQIMNVLFPPVKKTKPKVAITTGGYSTQASRKNATSSGATAHNTCAAYAGPNGANSTCARDDGRGVTTGVKNVNGAQGVGRNSN